MYLHVLRMICCQTADPRTPPEIGLHHTNKETSMSKHLVKSALIALTTLATLSTMIGCGMGASDSATGPLTVPAFSGKSMGGQMPIIGATVKLYATTSTGYGTGTLLKEATQQGTSVGQDTNSGGGFTIPGPITCPAGQFAYIVSSGGNTGANTVNANAVLVAALGRCEDLYTSTTGGTYDGPPLVYINELTTVAAAYALGNFSSVTGTGAATVVGIGSDATNNAAKVGSVSTGCVAGVGSCTTTATAGLAHAFLNAANLVNPFANTLLTGANAAPPTDSAAIAPQQLLDTIGNILVACVNSTGGVAGDGTTACGSIFGATTIGTSVPVNTYSAMVNLAANPTLGGSAVAVGNLYAVSTAGTSIYSPALTTATGLNDFSLAINYPKGLGAALTAATATCTAPPCQGLTDPTSGALDINDVYYLGNQSASGGAVPVNLFAFSSNGTLLSTTSNGVTLKFAEGLSVDALGNGYFGNASGSGTSALGVFTTGGGNLSQYSILPVASNALKVYGTAVDKANNVWAFGAPSATSSLFMSPAGGASFTAEGAPGGTPPSNGVGIAIDPDQNVWTTAATTLSVLQNTGTAAVPAYSSTSLLTDTTSGSPAIGIAFTPNGTGAYNAYVSSYNTAAGIQPYTPTYTGAEVTALGQGTINNVSATITGTYQNEADGAGNIWLADVNSHSIIQYNPAASTPTAYRYEPCLGGATTCASVFVTGKPFTVAIDSAGSIWTAAQAGGNVVQIIGAAAPTWPLLSLGKTGKP